MSEQNGEGSHHTEIVCGEVSTGDEQTELARNIERAYGRIHTLALSKGRVVMSTIQSCVSMGSTGICYIITVQWVTREQLESLQRQQAILQSIPPGRRN